MGTTLFVLFLFLSLFAWAKGEMTVNVDKNQKHFEVALPANPTTGYEWSVVEYDKNFLTLGQSEYKKPQSALIGAGGTKIFTFMLNEGAMYPNKTIILFRYSRPWESDLGTTKKVVVTFF